VCICVCVCSYVCVCVCVCLRVHVCVRATQGMGVIHLMNPASGLHHPYTGMPRERCGGGRV